MIDAGEKLRVIGTLRTGLENINVEYATQKGIKVFNTPGRLAETVSDFTIGAIISEARNIARGHAALKAGVWRRDYHNNDFIPELGGRTVGLVGFGAIAQAVARGGLPKNDPIIAMDANVIHYKEVTVHGSFSASPRDCDLALNLIAAGTINTGDFITHRLPLRKVEEGMDLIKRGESLKVVIKPQITE